MNKSQILSLSFFIFYLILFKYLNDNFYENFHAVNRAKGLGMYGSLILAFIFTFAYSTKVFKNNRDEIENYKGSVIPLTGVVWKKFDGPTPLVGLNIFGWVLYLIFIPMYIIIITSL